jgi:hypothetical protein
MSDETEIPKQVPLPQDPPKPVTAEELRAVNFEAAIPDPAKVEPQEFCGLYAGLAREAAKKQQLSATRVYSLLSGICGMHLKTGDRAEPWGPMFVMDNWRSLIPSDLKGEQNAALLEIVDRIKNPGLRARIADLVWTNDRKTGGRAGAVAVDAYRECAEGLMTGAFKPYPDESHVSVQVVRCVQRALTIAQATTKKNSKGRALFSDALKDTVLKFYASTKDDKEYGFFEQTARLVLHYELIDQTQVAHDAEELAKKSQNEGADSVKSFWQLAAQLRRNLKDKDGEQRCLFDAAKQTLEMRQQFSRAGAEAHWVYQALLELRHVEGQEELKENLLAELRRLQLASTNEMASFPITLDLTDMCKDAEAVFESLSLSDALLRFALIAQPTPIEQLKQEARDQLRDYPILNMLSASHIDGEGKTIAISPRAETGSEQPDGWYRQQALQSEYFRHIQIVGGYIHPARIMIHTRFQIEERHIKPIIYSSPFVPIEQAAIITLGVTRFFQGDFMSAAHLLIIQLEPCLRHILKIHGHDPVLQRDDGTEEEFDINKIFTRMRPELISVFGEDLVYEIDLLFVGRPGPSLRNDLAHGHLSSSACFSPTVIYGFWLIYKLCVGFLISCWDQFAPDIDAAV